MKITSVNVRKEERPDSIMKGNASVLIDDCFVINNIRILQGEEGLFIAMPSRKTSTGKYRDVAHPINQETRKMFQDAVLEAYNNIEE